MRNGKLLATAGLLLVLAGIAACGGAPENPFDSAQGKLPDPDHNAKGGWTAAPAYLAMFTADRAHKGAYTAFVTPVGIRGLLDTMPGLTWEPVAQLPSDAFGQTGSYDRWKMAKLYGSTRALVARGPVTSPAGTRQAWTLISPYPDPTLERLEPGTLIIELNLQAP